MKRICLLLVALLLTWTLNTLHMSVAIPPAVGDAGELRTPLQSYYFPRKETGIHQVVLEGTSFERGQLFGHASKDLLFEQERELDQHLKLMIPGAWVRGLMFLFSMRWFYGIDEYIEKPHLEEMYGVSLFASKEFNYLADPFTRQVAYHGLHEVGQMMVDRGFDGPACTQIAWPTKEGWLIGRNFDFEAGRIFDREKIMKWVFPDRGYPFVSVIFAGMVGSVTGVNNQGVYVAINAAGSDDFARLGHLSTLLVTEALQNAASAEEAVEILESKTSMITDIYVVADRGSQLYIVEKSPAKTRVLTKKLPMAVTNHLQHPDWNNDQTNRFRMASLTTVDRFKRASYLTRKMAQDGGGVEQMLSALRDKKDANGGTLSLGHRKAIDALIATHAVIYDSGRQQLYVSQGPSLAGPFLSFDLARSFAKKLPVVSGSLPGDSAVNESEYHEIKQALADYTQARQWAADNRCDKAEALLGKHSFTHYYGEWALAELAKCRGQRELALHHWQKALELEPAYQREVDAIQKEMER